MMSCLMGSRTRTVLTISSRAGSESLHSWGGMTLMMPDCIPYLSTLSICGRNGQHTARRRAGAGDARGGRASTHKLLEILKLVHGGPEHRDGARVVVRLDVAHVVAGIAAG